MSKIVTVRITKKAESLFRATFLLDGNVACSGSHTSFGTMPLWGQLVRAGLVLPHKDGPVMGHKFAYELTDLGRDYLEQS